MSKGDAGVLLIQSDWNTILSDVGAAAWISCKSKDKPGIHGKIRTIRCLPDSPSVSVSDGFSVENITSTSITVRHQGCPYTTVFLAPYRTYSVIHKGSVQSIDVNDESLAVSFSSKGDLLVWDTKTEETKVSLKGHLFEVYKCRFFPSGQVVLSCGSDMTLRIWCAKTGRCPVTLKAHTMAVTDCAFIARGKNVLSTSKDGTVKLWNCGDGSCIADVAKVSSSINCCQVLQAPSYLSLNDGQIPQSKKEVDTQNKIVIYGCEDGSVECVALASRLPLFDFNVGSPVNCISTLDEDNFVVGCQNGQIILCNFKNPDNTKNCHESNSAVLSLLSVKKMGFFASRADGSVTFSSLADSSRRISLTGPNFDPIYDMSSDGKHLYTCCRDGSVRIYIVDNILNCTF